jgi:hypothetical protein
VLEVYEAWETARLDADGIETSARPVYASLGPGGMAVDGLMRYWQKKGVRG